MATFREVTILDLLILLIGNIDLTAPLEVDLAFGVRGGLVWFEARNSYRLSDIDFTSLLYRSIKDDLVLLINSSNPSHRSASHLAAQVDYQYTRFSLRNLSVSDEGRYITERWRNAILRESRAYDLTVCEDEVNLVTIDQAENDAVWIMENVTVEEGDRLLVYKEDEVKYYLDNPGIKMLIVNTSLPISDDLTGEANVFISNSTVICSLTGYPHADYHFLIWSEHHCRAYGKRLKSRWQPGGGRGSSVGFLKAGKSITLDCDPLVKHMEVFTWETPLKHIYVDRSLPADLTQQEKETMHVDPSNDSLTIPSLSTEHSGSYTCHSVSHEVFVCNDLEDIT
ncbi:hypothetical protein ACEWY4_008204 [Coilia grayii]|uniref:Ig-like domain-containing protein n=1 Tax=Coilia grayii TaxID=363190 RepID=A0ABD1KA85_9TELE